MNFHILSVQRSGPAANSRPKIQFYGQWLAEIGFVGGVLVQALPQPDGFVFNLCNENVNYSDLFHDTKEKGGSLIRTFILQEHKRNGPSFVTAGKYIGKAGLKAGDVLVAKCEYGYIRVRKADENVHLMRVRKTKKEYTGEPVPKLWIEGDWMNGINFTPDTLVTAAPVPGCITFTAYGKDIVYSDIVKIARQNKMRLIQVTATPYGHPLINITGWICFPSAFRWNRETTDTINK